MATVIVSKAAKAAKAESPPAKCARVKLRDSVHVPDPEKKHGIEVFGAGDVVEVPAAFADRFVRIGIGELA